MRTPMAPQHPFGYPMAPWAQHRPPHIQGGIPPGCSLCPKWGFGPVLPSGPPKRDPPKEPLREAAGCRDAPCVRNAAPIGQQQPPLVGVTGFKALQRLARRRSKDVEFQEGWFGSKGKGWAPLRHRSSSEVTLSECDPEEATEPRGAKLGAGGGIFREYGSTSSIDIQGISEQSFFEMLNEFRTKKPERRAASPERLGEAAFPMGSSTGIKADNRNGAREEALPQCKEKPRRRCPKGDASTESIFRKLRSTRNDAEPEEPRMPEPGRSWWCQKSFAHYDVQSILFDLNAVATNRVLVAQRRNTTTGASAASSGMGSDPAFPGAEDPNSKENLEHDLGDNTSNELLLSCPHFRNEIGGAGERNVSFSKASGASPVIPVSDGSFPEPVLDLRPTNAAISVLEVPKELQRNPNRLKHYSVEHVDLGARYYRDHFHGKEHSNYFGVDEKLGPVAVSIKREKLEDHKDHGPQYQYRLIFRTSELITLRGSILEDATPTTTKHGTVRGLPLKDALEYVIPELNIHCLRLALSTPKVTEQLLKLDEQGLCRRHKVGILYCKAGQSSEEEMYNNEEAGSAFEEFLMLLGEKVCLKAFSKYAAQLDTKTDSTGTHSLYTTYQDYEIMFHVSTMLPYTPNNRQQLLRKRHIGNDIVTIIFQEPGALPFTPQNIRSHFQHVFIIVRAHNPCTENVSYSVAVTRSKDVPSFGPPIPNGVTFRKSDVFREFLLAKVINAENAAHKSDKFHTMATRTRREYLKDLAENWVTNTPIDSSGKFNLISLASKKKEKTKARIGAEQHSAGAISWRVSALDFARGAEISCALGISNEFVVLLDLGAKEVVFNCFCGDVIGWTAEAATIKIFYGRGDHIFIRAGEGGAEDIKEIVQRLKVMTDGCDTVDMTLRRNGLGQLGFHVKYDGTVAEVEDYGFAWQAGLRQGSRLVEICKVAVVTLSHEQMIDLLRTSVTVKVVIVPPHEDGAPRRGWSECVALGSTEPREEPERGGCPPRPPYRSSAAWQWSSSASHSTSLGPTAPHGRPGKQAVLPPHGKRPLSFPETPHPSSSSSPSERPQPYRQPSGSFSAPGSTFTRYKPSPERFMAASEPPDGDSSSGGVSSHESTMERHNPEPLWHVPAQPRLPTGRRSSKQEPAGMDSPKRHSKGEAPYSSHSSTTTLSSTASSDERWFDIPDPNDGTEFPDPFPKGSSNDSGIDTPKPPRPLSQRDKGPKAIVAPGDDATPPRGIHHPPAPATGTKLGPPPQPSSNPRMGYPGYGTPTTEAPRGGPQLSASIPKSFFSKQPVRNKQATGWKRAEEKPEPQKQVEATPKNVFGQPRLRASLRDLRSPRRTYKSTIEDDLKKLIIMDSTSPEPERAPTPPKGLQRTLSDESLCGGRRDPSYPSGSPVLDAEGSFGSTYPSSTLPNRRQHPATTNGGLHDKKGPISASELSLRRVDPGMMPLPDTATGLEWASLVNAAKAYEVQRAVSLFSLTEPVLSPDPPQPPERPRGGAPPISPPTPLDLPEKVSQLEAMLKQLHSDLQKEKQDKVVLQAEVANLRHNNRRLQQESHSAARQLRRFARIFSGTVDKEEL
ncbi:LOW QUALITY PROTEIN: signal-induced proliferation-associated 1-like protein 3 [Melopsittacus undulatus]|uniref:LOW QUALITY PROTEIN: signal-induced proliferation-associated 1-like protein 3 n=1 Tax=Melopsittacus undulatus TaxID=13146 RepID=UPI00146F273C|nr:LOW QUALITY PROTEIN: signal-induced proliferation-associated 1-like protein 3 [Melopsittacus undulatus]